MHISWCKFTRLENEHPYHKDGFKKYCKRILEEVGYIPPDVLKQWLYGLFNFPYVIEEFGDIDYTKVYFDLEEWEIQKILKVEPTNFGKEFFKSRIKQLHKINGDIKKTSYGHLDQLVNFWHKEQTWQTPPIILLSKMFTEREYKQPFQLVEGHNRLAWFNYFATNDLRIKLKNTHKVWVMKKRICI